MKINVSSPKLKRLLKVYKVRKLALFGSYVNAKLHKNSDIDFLVDFEKGADLFDQVGLKLELERLFHRKVDVVTPNALSKYFRAKVLKEAVYL